MCAVITVENLSKQFTISHEERERYTSLRDVVARRAKSIFSSGRKSSHRSVSREDFWALRDINFEVQQGDRIGIIGRNGAGKSTLLKILSRITMPTTGRVTIDGRVASLLEVGTGFHPELTGRENIFLNGAILGMGRVEIRKKFDEIVAFAEVEKFLDTPVKRYSSGMYVRLAFAVAAHLEPEILIVDEVLAVGDAQFQKKCLGKMEDVSKNEGRTVLFVSHQIDAINALTHKCMLLKNGHIVAFEETAACLRKYLYDMSNARIFIEENKKEGTYISKIAVITAGSDANSNIVYWGEELILEFDLHTDRSVDKLHFSFQVFSSQGKAILHVYPENLIIRTARKTSINTYTFRCVLPKVRLYLGDYFITTWISSADSKQLIQHLDKVLPFSVNIDKLPPHGYVRSQNDCVYIDEYYFA